MKLNNRQIKKDLFIKSGIVGVIEEFGNACSLHGVKYVFKRNSPIKERLLWSLLLLSCVVTAVVVCHELWLRYRQMPVVIDVKDTRQPLHTFPFPTITVCSGTRIRRITAVEILSRYMPVDIPTKTKDDLLIYIMSILSLLQFPNYNLMKPYLRAQEVKRFLYQFMDLNITNFMLRVMPTCEEVFNECFWHGTRMNCCEIFLLQRTEEGFCWSFNSLTADETAHCPISEMLENEGVKEEDDKVRPECQLRRNTGISTGSGLELYLLPTNPGDNFGYRAQRVLNGVSAGTGVYVPNIRGAHMSIAVAAEVTMSSESIRQLPVQDRRCIFPDEKRLHIHHVYTESSCLAECRLKYIMLMCRCKLYFFNIQELHVPDCGVLHLSCIAKHSDKFRFYRPPQGTPGIADRELMDSLNCGCRFTCYDSVYDIHLQRRIPDHPNNWSRFAHVDIYYSKTGFVRYQRHIVFEFIDLIVSLGGVANLFLGFSLLSLFETLYWLFKIFIVATKNKTNKSRTITVQPIGYLE